jgi:hypothetical protein
MIDIDFDFDTQYGHFSDALHLPDDNTYTPEEIEVMKLDRLNNWLYVIENPVVDPPADTSEP